ncbi:MAG: helix-turn-helix transcriptional regulator [Lachnospiraceae bacterium]|nr:helix-turn-helix transcriptional regulator [Lachnospiraceae bacterium]
MADNNFSALDNDIICVHKKDILTRYPKVTYHNHDGYEIYIFVKGDADYYVEENARALTPGDVILIPPYTFHAVDSRSSECYERIIINIKENYIKQFITPDCDLTDCFHRFPISRLNLLSMTSGEIKRIAALVSELEYALDHNAFGNSLLIPALLTQILVLINKKALMSDDIPSDTNALPDIVKLSIEYINSHFTENMHVSDLEKYVHHQKDYIVRRFKAVTGLSVQEYILAKRLSLAKQYLAAGRSAGEVCYLCGFCNYSNFSRTFKKHLNISPKEYQKNAAKKNPVI